MSNRIYLSPPHMGGQERRFVEEAFDTNWIAPLGPNVDKFESEFAALVGSEHAVALSSGTAALHLALRLAGIGTGDRVLVSSLTFSASVNPILYEGGTPVFVDSELISWNIDPNLVEDAFVQGSKNKTLPKALIAVHLYGQSADLDPIASLCERFGVMLIEDAAEALGATYKGRSPGTFGSSGIFSFNGNKIITTSGGGMMVTDDETIALHARKLATQARDNAPHYQHSELGFNYRMSNILAGVGRGQLQVLRERVEARRKNFEYYHANLGPIQGVIFMPEADWGQSTRWLTCLTVDPEQFGCDREVIRLELEKHNVEARPVWKPMHLQPIFSQYESIGGTISEKLFDRGLCLPSGSSLSEADLARVTGIIKDLHYRLTKN